MPAKVVIALAFLAGALLGIAQYLPDISAGIVSLSAPPTQNERKDSAQDKRVRAIVEHSVDLDALMALQPPPLDAPLEAWTRFLQSLDTLPRPSYYRSGSTAPIVVWYAYVAKHRPDAFNARFGDQGISGVDLWTVEHLLRSGFLQDWYERVPDPGPFLLYRGTAAFSLVLGRGPDQARRELAERWLQALSSDQSRTHWLDLTELPYAMRAMTDKEIASLLPSLISGDFTIDPREIDQLAQTGRFATADLLALMRKYAYTDKDMSSFVATAASLGAEEYLPTLVADLKDNARQPLHFYCAPCALAIVADGLIGGALMDAAAQGQLQITSPEIGRYVLSRTDTASRPVSPGGS